MTKEEKELAKELFLKVYHGKTYLTDLNKPGIMTDLRNSIAVAKLFYEEVDKE